ncbi:NAD(P)H dehydrogenase [Sinorhizobium fredii NGR234]|uniref:NAD(P)H dehydrogenase n=1 Tax=Sinorhizobium fredii (strain NBRC 101917 / NGR234) TaxID=394 RepID=C3MCR0_SINFN|nr:NAD(P)H dehydrogenase [Sinorhizobium fredii NGR234]
MRILMVLAHPLEDSFAASVAKAAKHALEGRGHTVDLLDLYRERFDPRLSAAERGSFFAERYDASEVTGWIERLRAAEGLVLVFPQWWFNFPAILKGFFDRVFAPGVAFEHDQAGGRIIPRLSNIKLFWALTTTGSPCCMIP